MTLRQIRNQRRDKEVTLLMDAADMMTSDPNADLSLITDWHTAIEDNWKTDKEVQI